MNLCPLPLFRERFSVFNSKRFSRQARAAPEAVLVLVLVEIVLAVAAIPVDLRKRCRIEFPVVRDERTAVPASADPVLDEFELALDPRGRVLQTVRPSPSKAAGTVSFLSRLMWTYRVNPQTIGDQVVHFDDRETCAAYAPGA